MIETNPLPLHLVDTVIKKVKVPILMVERRGPEVIPDSRQSAVSPHDSMHGHEPDGGLPPPPTRPTATHTCIS